ncbi:hypothetical protein LLS1_24350 [Leifsonia sp. LS1]|uniref:mannosyltransferase family protein n=1 Tax=Leifsonia sp. LS1 TaxID=2828483 RepID=UPI001CFCB587|nr:mannosyltransferase family protein [Leifsonia sp. LS1]GIT80766.1 hypothetical protein LLS1_24350 [Leifsonia sp. LS1]
MSERSVIARSRRAWSALPRWVRICLVALAARVLSLILLLIAFTIAHAHGWTGMDARHPVPDSVAFLGMWDSRWYAEIATQGYPHQLPMVGGSVGQNAWAFLPVFPALVRGLMATGAPFPLLGTLISIAASAAAAVVLHRLVSLRVAPQQARWAVLLFCFSPWSFIFSTAYAEALFVLLLFSGLVFIEQRRYELATAVAVVAAFTRPGALALALVLAIHLVVRFVRRRDDPLAVRDAARITVAGLVTASAGLAWPLIAAAVTGRPDAYIATETAWWSNTIPDPHLFPLTPWFLVGYAYLGIAGAVAVAVAVAAGIVWMCGKPFRRLGPVTAGYLWSYTLYLFAVFLPQQSLPRVMLPLAPAFADERLTRTRARRVGILVVFLALQPVAIALLWLRGAP